MIPCKKYSDPDLIEIFISDSIQLKNILKNVSRSWTSFSPVWVSGYPLGLYMYHIFFDFQEFQLLIFCYLADVVFFSGSLLKFTFSNPDCSPLITYIYKAAVLNNLHIFTTNLHIYYWRKVICERVSTVWHAVSLNICLVMRTHAGKQAFLDQSQCPACIVVKVMFFDAQHSWNSMRSHITFHQ